jgi:cytochrome c-type biogenesis protein
VDFGIGTYTFGLLAGAISVLSPCVLPLLPIVIASALSKHRFGSLALAAGLALSFAAVGIFLATAGASLGLDDETFRRAAAVLMVLFGLVMLSARLQAGFTRIGSVFAAGGQRALGSVVGEGWSGQLLVGLLLGVVWSPCVGPTLGAATTLAAQGRNLAQIALLMIVFGVGAGLPLLILGSVSRATLTRIRGSLTSFGKVAKMALGCLFVMFGVFVLTGFDRQIETLLVTVSPAWLNTLTTSF